MTGRDPYGGRDVYNGQDVYGQEMVDITGPRHVYDNSIDSLEPGAHVDRSHPNPRHSRNMVNRRSNTITGHDVYGEDLGNITALRHVYGNSTDSFDPAAHERMAPTFRAPLARYSGRSDDYMSSGWQEWPGVGRSGHDSIPATPGDSRSTTPMPSPVCSIPV